MSCPASQLAGAERTVKTHRRVRDKPDDEVVVDQVLRDGQVVRQIDESGDSIVRDELA